MVTQPLTRMPATTTATTIALTRPHERAPHRRAPVAIGAGLAAADRPLPLARRDTLPDYAEYRDTGCELAPSCLRCPFARCQYDVGGGVRRHMLDRRDREIALLRRRHHAPIDMLAGTYGVSRRTIFRILRRFGDVG
jgi:hypothetical protein